MNERMNLFQALGLLPAGGKALLRALFAAALLTLALGLIFGFATALMRAGLLPYDPQQGYRLMTLHGVTVFFYWLAFAQAGMLLVFAIVEARGRLAIPSLAWAGLLALALGFLLNLFGSMSGPPLLYDGSPEVAGEEKGGAALFYSGYLLLGAGLFLLPASAIATLLEAKRRQGGAPWSALGFGAMAWAGLLMVSAIALVNTFLPALLWAMGKGALPSDHASLWHVLFHNMHYLPLLGTVLCWYLLMPEVAGTGSILGARFSKMVFSSYLLLVPPTSLYHMFLEPNLAPLVLVAGSMLSLLISVPTVAAFLIVVVSLEATARAAGRRGMFGWIAALPWRDPATAALGAAVVNLALGGVFAFVLIQEKLAGLLSDTFFVPGYFHFLTLGTVTLTLLAAMVRILPVLSGGGAWMPALLARLPWIITLGLVIFGAAGIAAGVQGMPRRILDPAYGGEGPAAWLALSKLIGLGASVMALALLAYVLGLLGALFGLGAKPEPALAPPLSASLPEKTILRQAAWSGPLSVALLVALMYAATWAAFAAMRALPVIASAGAGH